MMIILDTRVMLPLQQQTKVSGNERDISGWQLPVAKMQHWIMCSTLVSKFEDFARFRIFVSFECRSAFCLYRVQNMQRENYGRREKKTKVQSATPAKYFQLYKNYSNELLLAYPFWVWIQLFASEAKKERTARKALNKPTEEKKRYLTIYNYNYSIASTSDVLYDDRKSLVENL